MGIISCNVKAQQADTLQSVYAQPEDSLFIEGDDDLPQYGNAGHLQHEAGDIFVNFDSLMATLADSVNLQPWSMEADPYFANFDPIPTKAVWYAALFPGGGQIYNRKFWKLPIIYGGYIGLIYGYRWNQRYYRTYANAYRDLALNSPNKSYMDFLPPTYPVEARRSYLEKTFKRKRNSYRQYRDYCLVGMIGVYLVAMVDAYVDAALYHFDVSTDLDACNRPTLMLGYHIDF